MPCCPPPPATTDDTPAGALMNGSPAGPVPTGPADARTWRSADLLGTRNEIQIDHHGAIYRLRVTSLGKLILTK